MFKILHEIELNHRHGLHFPLCLSPSLAGEAASMGWLLGSCPIRDTLNVRGRHAINSADICEDGA